jgi:ferritin
MLKKTVLKALNDQINAELFSAYMYLGMSAWCEDRNLPGFAGWMRKQFEEEQKHALKIFDYVLEQNDAVSLAAIAQPPAVYKSLQEIWEETYAHEQHVTSLIHKVYALAVKEQDFATQALMQWYVTEQIEEEHQANSILEQVKMVGTNSSAVFFLDRHVGKTRDD